MENFASHSFDPTILREYDIRGVIGKTLGVSDAIAIGRAFATMVRRVGGTKIAVGFDGRLSSPQLSQALIDGAMSAGVDVVTVGCGPTPMLYFAVHHLDLDGGIMITGSHNPPDYNGFKFMLGKAPFYGEKIQELGAISKAGQFANGKGGVQQIDIQDVYVARLMENMDFPKNRTIAWDPGNGASAEILQRLVKLLGGTHHLINAEIDGTFPAHHPDPTVPENLYQLQSLVQEKGCDIGFAFDGDGDRIGLIDEEGEILWGDQLLLLLAHGVLKENPGAPIIADVKASQVLFDGVAKLGGKPIMAPTGHSIIKAKMKETGAPLAGEMSAHIFFSDRYYGFDDALYAALRVMESLEDLGISLRQFRLSLPNVVNTPEMRFPCAEEDKFPIVERIKTMLLEEGAEVNTIDGVRVKRGSGWWLLRASNTQDVLVARCEADSQEGLESLKKEVTDYLKSAGMDLPLM